MGAYGGKKTASLTPGSSNVSEPLIKINLPASILDPLYAS